MGEYKEMVSISKRIVKRLLGARATQRIAGAVNKRRVERLLQHDFILDRTSSSTKIALKNLYLNYRSMATRAECFPIWDAGFSVLSQFDEDGIILYLLAFIDIRPTRKFVEIGGSMGIFHSNCSNLSLNLHFQGLFIDMNPSYVDIGYRFYERHPDTSSFPPRFRCAKVTKSNVNHLIGEAEIEGEVDVLSIDIDGNDYWIWEAIQCISPRIVVIETNPALGMTSIVVPYDEGFAYDRNVHGHYLGASLAAMTGLAKNKGYRLVGANVGGFNIFFVRDDLGRDLVPEIEIDDIFQYTLQDKDHVNRIFGEIKHLEFEKV